VSLLQVIEKAAGTWDRDALTSVAERNPENTLVFREFKGITSFL
jgi:hypothetical protein